MHHSLVADCYDGCQRIAQPELHYLRSERDCADSEIVNGNCQPETLIQSLKQQQQW